MSRPDQPQVKLPKHSDFSHRARRELRVTKGMKIAVNVEDSSRLHGEGLLEEKISLLILASKELPHWPRCCIIGTSRTLRAGTLETILPHLVANDSQRPLRTLTTGRSVREKVSK